MNNPFRTDRNIPVPTLTPGSAYRAHHRTDSTLSTTAADLKDLTYEFIAKAAPRTSTPGNQLIDDVLNGIAKQLQRAVRKQWSPDNFTIDFAGCVLLFGLSLAVRTQYDRIDTDCAEDGTFYFIAKQYANGRLTQKDYYTLTWDETAQEVLATLNRYDADRKSNGRYQGTLPELDQHLVTLNVW